MKTPILFFSLLVNQVAMAMITGPYSLEGKIRSFDKNSVVIETSDSQIKAPREFFKGRKILSGEKIQILLTEDQFHQLSISKIPAK